MAIATLKSTRDFVRVWFYWKKQAIFIFCLIVFCICLYSFTRTPLYESTAKIMILPKSTDELVISPGEDPRQYLTRQVSSQDINTEIELLKSDVVIKRLVAYYQQQETVPEQSRGGNTKLNFFEKLKLTKKPLAGSEREIKSLFSALNVDPVFSSNMILISLESPYQNQVRVVLDRLLKTYLQYRNQTFSSVGNEAFYDEQKNYYSIKMDAATKKLEGFNRQFNIVNMESQTSANIELISIFQKQLKNLELSIAEADAKISLLKGGLTVDGDSFVLTREMRNMPVIVELARGLVPLLIKRTEISKTFTKQSREYKQIDDQIRMLRGEIKRESIGVTRTDVMENKTLQIRRVLLAKKIDSLKEQSNLFQQKKQSHTALELDVEIARRNFLKYGEKKEDSRLFAKRDDSDLSNVVIAEPATTPKSPKSPNKILALEVSIILGFFAALILPFLLETVDHKLKTSDDVESILALPVVCSYNEIN